MPVRPESYNALGGRLLSPKTSPSSAVSGDARPAARAHRLYFVPRSLRSGVTRFPLTRVSKTSQMAVIRKRAQHVLDARANELQAQSIALRAVSRNLVAESKRLRAEVPTPASRDPQRKAS